ncbi:TRAP transporter small permease [Colwellia sp. MB02u-6]|uniref:TRAP transporter small permease n=1 Tax=Colwellia sp. MB02u-6 TaxID=2759824 RepID=UPI0015F3913C|nr:TRAP transporter small permease [Colwellia sp. MB02u-6]MBA6326882.1 TRAP transporter small permease [Colwellia sp. MB02u-6]
MNIKKLASSSPEQQFKDPTVPKYKVLQKLESILDYCLRGAMVFTGLGLAVLMFTQVIMRYVLESPFAGIEEAAILLAVWVSFLGMGYATKKRSHIHGGIVSLIVYDAFKIQMLRFIVSVICLITACIFGYFSAKYGLFVIEKERMSLYLQWPKGLWTASMVFGFLLMSVYFLLQTLKDFRLMVDIKDQSHNSNKG